MLGRKSKRNKVMDNPDEGEKADQDQVPDTDPKNDDVETGPKTPKESYELEKLPLNSDVEKPVDVDADGLRSRKSGSGQLEQEQSPLSGTQLETEETAEESEEQELKSENRLGKIMLKGRGFFSKHIRKHIVKLKYALLVLIFILYNAYLITAILYKYNSGHKNEPDFCNGLEFLLIITGIVYWSLFYYYVLKPSLRKSVGNCMRNIGTTGFGKVLRKTYMKYILILLLCIGLIIFLIIDTKDQPIRLRSAAGIVILVILGFLISRHPGHVIWRQVLLGVTYQFILGLIILRWDFGRNVFKCISTKVKNFLEFTDVGTAFIYGYLSQGREFKVTNAKGMHETISLLPVFAFKSLPIIFFFSFFISILYYYGIMQWFCSKIGWALQIMMGTTAGESINAAANIFIGLAEAPILIKPYLPEMTNSELCAVMTSGFATIAGTVLGAYISFGISPSHLISASVMAAPASLAFAKLIYPETRMSKTKYESIKVQKIPKSGNNVLDAAAKGCIEGGFLVAAIIACIIGFVSFIAFVNALVRWFGGLVGLEFLSFEWMLSKLCIPIAWIIGIDLEEIEDVSLLLGLKIVINEFIAYQKLTTLKISPRSRAISTYALCSFANFATIGIQLGGLGSMVPSRRGDLANTVLFAFVAANGAGLLNACIAGTLLDELSYSEWMSQQNSNKTFANSTTTILP